MSIKQQVLSALRSYVSTDGRLSQLQIFVESIAQASVAEYRRYHNSISGDSRITVASVYLYSGAADSKNVGFAFNRVSIWTFGR